MRREPELDDAGGPSTSEMLVSLRAKRAKLDAAIEALEALA